MSQQAPQFTLGVEEEYQVINPHTRELSPDVERILPYAQATLGDAVQYELILSQIEIATPICHTLEELQAELIRLRGGVIRAAERIDRQIAAAGTHPFSHWRDQLITPKARYRQLVETYQQLIREQIIFGCHVHVSVPSHEIGVLILNYARLWLAPLLALSANSPFWLGDDTGYDSYRSGLWLTVPLSGPPPHFPSNKDYKKMVDNLVETCNIQDATRLYWDLRLSERFPTIEFRVMDVCLTIRETVLLAGLIRALVRRSHELIQEGKHALNASTEMLKVAHWHAARYGLHNSLINPTAQHIAPATQVLHQFLEFVRPALEQEGDWRHISSALDHTLHVGNGATRQRAVYRQHQSYKDVVDFIVAETCADID